MMQEMTWTHERAEVSKSTLRAAASGLLKKHMVGNRVAKLTSGGLQGEKEFRPQEGSREPQAIETPGLFGRGNDNPLDTDQMRVVPGAGTGQPSQRGRSSAMDAFHANAAGPAPDEFSKRAAIHAALSGQNQERAAAGISTGADGGLRNLRGPR